jgi:hypothetical protein
LLKLGGSHVFRDEESIRPGKRWKAVITRNIKKAHKVLVFWTASAAKSRWVKKEYDEAIRRGKDVIPVLLDGTPLPKSLSEFQAIDLLFKAWPRGGLEILPPELVRPILVEDAFVDRIFSHDVGNKMGSG